MKLIEPYQGDGVRWMMKQEHQRKGGFLCDEMGLGKTIMMLALTIRNKVPKTLVVVPKSIVGQWKAETQKHTSLKVTTFDGPFRKLEDEFDICICPYSVLEDLSAIKWDRIILDEGHEIRNQKSKIHQTCMTLVAKYKWVVTGTPVFNHMRDFIALCRFLGLDGRSVQCYTDDIRKKYVLRRTRQDLLECSFTNVELKMSAPETALYDIVYSDFVDIAAETGPGDFAILEGILRCRQVCTWPQLYYDGIYKKYPEREIQMWDGSTAKMDYLFNSVKEHPDEKSLIFTQFIGESRHIEEMFRLEGIDAFRLDGETMDRENTIKNFKDSKPGSVFVIQIKCGGVGLNLQEASRVYITHPAWNPATELQAIARAHRTGQTRKVVVKKLIYVFETSIEQAIVDLQIRKAAVCAKVLDDEKLIHQIPGIEAKYTFAINIGKQNISD